VAAGLAANSMARRTSEMAVCCSMSTGPPVMGGKTYSVVAK
jgi:hypothetical protein